MHNPGIAPKSSGVDSDGDGPPDYVWWCFTCIGGVGVWGLDDDKPPPRCPECHGHNFAPIKFVPQKPTGGAT